MYLTHIFFVDDVLLFGDGSLLEWLHFKSLIDLFCSSAAMLVSVRKSAFGFMNISQEAISSIGNIFSFPWKPLDEGLTYLGFHLRPNNYRYDDWAWLVKKFHN